jgi:hypothetical protein
MLYFIVSEKENIKYMKVDATSVRTAIKKINNHFGYVFRLKTKYIHWQSAKKSNLLLIDSKMADELLKSNLFIEL